jgi:7-cyano-7-deazaguanine synthase
MHAASEQPAVVLLSGGLDSVTAMAVARSRGQAVHAMSFRYGQRHEHELTAARRQAALWQAAEHVVVDIDLGIFGGSALTEPGLAVPRSRPADEMSAGIPITYVPARNTIFLSYALALAEVRGAGDLYIGVNAIDYSGYPDCRPEYIAAFQAMADLATRAGVEGRGVRIRTPLLDLSKADIIRLGLSLGVDYSDTHSCYAPAPDGHACGACDACQLRLAGFAEVGAPDPAPYLARG